jgi:Leucine-rich repeat (LRR) protein
MELDPKNIFDVLYKITHLPRDVICLLMLYIQRNTLQVCTGIITNDKIPSYITHLKISCSIMTFSTYNLISLDCSGCNQTYLPLLPNCEFLTCYNNKLIELPPLNKCIELYCNNNNLISLPKLPNCKLLNCRRNKLINLPNMAHIEQIECDDNELVELPYFPRCKNIKCYDNNIIFKPLQPKICQIEWYRKSWMDLWGD